jgi:hypothetical protein
MVKRLFCGILAAVFVPLGLAFTIVGLTVKHPRSGKPEAFLYIGIPFLVVGLGLAVAFLVLRRREAERRRRRRAGLRATAEIVDAELNPHVRVGMSFSAKLTVDIPGAGTVTRAVLVSPFTRLDPGTPIDVVYDPQDPANFEPIAAPRVHAA